MPDHNDVLKLTAYPNTIDVYNTLYTYTTYICKAYRAMSSEEDDEEEQARFLAADSSKSKGHNIINQGGASWKRIILLFTLLLVSSFVAGIFFKIITSNIIASSSRNSGSGDDGYVTLLEGNDIDLSLSTTLQTKHNMKEIQVNPLFNATYTTFLTEGMQAILDANAGMKKHYLLDSPYEKRYPDYDLPMWAERTIPYNKNIDEEKQLCFVHVGKAGGSTLGCLLGFSLHCDNGNNIKGLLPIVTTHAFHRGVNDCTNNAAYYLFVVRDPLQRVLSTYNYERPNATSLKPHGKKNWHEEELYFECHFWTLEDLAQNGLLNDNNDEQSKTCKGKAADALSGVGRRYLSHLYFNYQYYVQSVFQEEDGTDSPLIPEHANILVIRINDMVEDWNTINLMLGGEPEVLKQEDIPIDNAHEKNATELFLSDSSKVELCRVLCNEIQIYKEIISRSMNLNDDEVTEAMVELSKSCPKEARESVCSTKLPDIRYKMD